MKLKKSLQLAFNIFVHSKLRSWLTIIGIIVGIAAVVAIVSMSLGAQQQLQSRLGQLGADVLTVTPGGGRASGFGFGLVLCCVLLVVVFLYLCVSLCRDQVLLCSFVQF
jgi:putative ABC transport system permease protein